VRANIEDFVIVTGMSGAGKSSVLKGLEDLDYFAIDNLPCALFPSLIDQILNGKLMKHHKRLAIGMDSREACFTKSFPKFLDILRSRKIKFKVLFLDAHDDVLLRRYSETRRRHPLAPNDRVIIGLGRERKLMEAVRNTATHIIDTSYLTIHDLRRRIRSLFQDASRQRHPLITLMSFGYRYGLPLEADMVFDVRFLPNPYFVPRLKHMTGMQLKVKNYVLKNTQTVQFLSPLMKLLKLILRRYVQEGKTYATIGIGCTGGRHRSVALTQKIASDLKVLGYPVMIQHRDMLKESKETK
jgi:UPF0042 nucleotide-binding protein